MATKDVEKPASPSAENPAETVRVRWDDAGARTSCPSMCQVASSREQVTISFGLLQPSKAGQQEIPIQVTDRIILSPQSARQLTMLLIKALREHDARFRTVKAAGA